MKNFGPFFLRKGASVQQLLGRPQKTTTLTALYRWIREALHYSNSKFLGRLTRSMLLFVNRFSRRTPNGFLRSLASVAQPIDPLGNAERLPAISIMIPFVEKDLPALESSIRGAINSVRNPVGEILLVTPADADGAGPKFGRAKSAQMFEDVLSHFNKVRVAFDHEILGQRLLELLASSDLDLDGWKAQQLVKFQAVLKASTPATLVVDADTVLLTPKTWLNSQNVQLLQFSEEFHVPYRNLLKSWIGLEPALPVSFVTHHQLMQKSIVSEIFPSEENLVQWCKLALVQGNRLSEYETYGQYLLRNYPSRVQFGSWSNLWSPSLMSYLDLASNPARLDQTLRGYNSISFHAHSQDSGLVAKTDNPTH